jgi:hypothetical protein
MEAAHGELLQLLAECKSSEWRIVGVMGKGGGLQISIAAFGAACATWMKGPALLCSR